MPAVIQEQKTSFLSTAERSDFLEAVEPTLFIRNQDQFCRWTQTELQRVFPHGMLVCGIGRFGADGVRIHHVMGCNFPPAYLQTLQRPDGLVNSPMLAKWMAERRPILFEPDQAAVPTTAPAAWLDNFQRYGLANIAAHGQCDVGSQTASYFSFSQIPGTLTTRHAYLLELLVPHLHVALARVAVNQAAQLPARARKLTAKQPRLSPRESEVLQWLCSGKSNWEIAQVLGVSENTAKNHVQHILIKLKVNSRAQAVAKAISLKLVRAKLAWAWGLAAELILQGQEIFDPGWLLDYCVV